MGLRILHTADWHMDAPFTSFSPAQRELLRREQLALPGKIAELCRREGCDLMLLAGDIFDGRPGPEAVRAVRQALADCGAAVFVAPGNHDFLDMDSPWLRELWPENVTVFTGRLESRLLPELNCRIYGAGYESMDCGPLLDGFRAEPGPEYHIGLLHADPITSQSPYCPITNAQVRDSGLHYLALGHIHKTGSLTAGGTLCAWPGCPMGRGWDETEEKGLLIVDVEDRVSARFLPLDTIRFYDLEAEVSEDPEGTLDRLLPAAGSRDFYRITLTGQTDGSLDGLEQRCAGFPNLILRDRTEAREDLWADVGSDTFRGAYFRLLQQQAREEPLALLAAELSKKLLAGREVRLP